MTDDDSLVQCETSSASYVYLTQLQTNSKSSNRDDRDLDALRCRKVGLRTRLNIGFRSMAQVNQPPFDSCAFRSNQQVCSHGTTVVISWMDQLNPPAKVVCTPAITSNNIFGPRKVPSVLQVTEDCLVALVNMFELLCIRRESVAKGTLRT